MSVQDLSGDAQFLAQVSDVRAGLAHGDYCQSDFWRGHFAGSSIFAAPCSR